MSIKGNIYVFLGPPGAGKGVQAKKLAQALAIPHISSGDLLRDECKQDTPFAHDLNKTISKGCFPEDTVILQLIENRVAKPDCQSAFILDGFPRTLDQAKILDARFSQHYNLIFINITIIEATLLKRLMGRRICSGCAHSFHVDFMPPKLPDVCDYCQHALVVRADDQPEVILKRFEIFKQKFEPMVQYYNNRSNWINLQSQGTPKECFDHLINQLEPFIQTCANA